MATINIDQRSINEKAFGGKTKTLILQPHDTEIRQQEIPSMNLIDQLNRAFERFEYNHNRVIKSYKAKKWKNAIKNRNRYRG